MERRPSYYLPSIGQFLFLIVFLVLTFSPAGKNMLADADTGYHIRAGDYILETRTVPKHDIFSYHSPPIPWTAHGWLSEVVMAVLHRISGLTGVVIFFLVLLSLTYALLFRYMRVYQRHIVFDVLLILLTEKSFSGRGRKRRNGHSGKPNTLNSQRIYLSRFYFCAKNFKLISSK